MSFLNKIMLTLTLLCTAISHAVAGGKNYSLNPKVKWQKQSDEGLISAAFNYDGSRIARRTGKSIVVYDKSGKQLFKLEDHSNGNADSVKFSPDGTKIIIGLIVYDITGKKLFELELCDNCNRYRTAISPDSKKFVVATQNGSTIYDKGYVFFYDLQSGKELLSIEPGPGVNSVKFNRDGTKIAFRSRNALYFLDQNGKWLPHLTEEFESTIDSMDFNHDGTMIAISYGMTFGVLDQNSKWLFGEPYCSDYVKSVAYSSDGSKIIVRIEGYEDSNEDREGKVTIYDQYGVILFEYKAESKTSIYSAALSPDQNKVAIATENGKLIVFDLNGKQLFEVPHGGAVYEVMFSPDSKSVITTTSEKLRLITF